MTVDETTEFSSFMSRHSTAGCVEMPVYRSGHGCACSWLLHHIWAVPLAWLVALLMPGHLDTHTKHLWMHITYIFFKITDQLASLTFYFSPLACQQYHQSAISPQKKRFCTSLFDNTRDSCVTFPPPRLSPHFPCTSNPHSQPIQVFQSASHARRMGRKWAGDILLEGVNGYHQMALWSADNYGAGPAHQMQGLLLSPISSFCSTDAQKCHQL